jgi:cysteine desulfurase
MPDRAYLDHNATAPLRDEAFTLIADVLRETGNPSSIHRFGRAARAHVETARGAVASALDVGPGQVVFTSGATEGNNTILRGFAGRRILASAIEHPAIRDSGVEHEKIPVTPAGLVDLARLESMLSRSPVALVSIQLVNNETGVIQPVAEAARLARAHGALLHCDAVQGFGRIPFTRASLGADFLTLSSHKIGGPQGVGATVFAPGAPLPKLLSGGGQERRQRAGTENVAGIAGFGAAVGAALRDIAAFQDLAALRDALESRIAGDPRVTIYGRGAPRVANTSCFGVSGWPAETQLIHYDLAGIAVSSGAACSSGSVQPSAVLTAMGVSAEDARCAIRVSFGWNSQEKDMALFLSAWNKRSARN